MKVIELYRQDRPVFSFEFFLPKTPESKEALFSTLKELRGLDPDFVTLTYGAAGSAREATAEMAGLMKNRFGFETMMHLTGIAHGRFEIEEIVRQAKVLGIENLMALRGDIPKEGAVLPSKSRDYKHAVDLVRHLRQLGDWCLGVAGYPEGHPEALSKEDDLLRLKEKAGAGADFIITQLFFDNSRYFDFVAKARSAGIAQPIIPGIMPITNYAQIQKFALMCGAVIPNSLQERLDPVQGNSEAVATVGVDYATEQCEGLLREGVPGIHFYTLNKSRATREILKRIRADFKKPPAGVTIA